MLYVVYTLLLYSESGGSGKEQKQASSLCLKGQIAALSLPPFQAPCKKESLLISELFTMLEFRGEKASLAVISGKRSFEYIVIDAAEQNCCEKQNIKFIALTSKHRLRKMS